MAQNPNQSEILNETAKFVDDFAQGGLRTLFLAKKNINKSDYEQWNKKFDKAMLSTENRE